MITNYLELRCALDTLQRDLVELSSQSVAAVLDDDVPAAGMVLTSTEAKDLLITQTRVSHLHGGGILLSQILDPKTYINVWTYNQPIKGEFQGYWVKAAEQSRATVFGSVVKALARENIRRILCVPYYSEDFQVGIVAKSILAVPLVVWVMDKCFREEEKIASELFSLADIRFVISSEMRDVYETKFRKKFYVLPPTVRASWIGRFAQSDILSNLAKKTCVMIGNIWDQQWLDNLCRVVQKSGWTIHWYRSRDATPWIVATAEKLADYGIVDKGYLPQKELAKCVATYPFAIVPSGSGDKGDGARDIALLSLPSRIPFLLATTNIPILVVGSEKNCAAKFVQRFRIGLTTEYDEQPFLAALEKMSNREFLAQCSERAAQHANIFSDEGLEEWIWKSCEKGTVIDDRFEKIFQKQPGNLTRYREEFVPQNLNEKFRTVYLSLRRLARGGYQPDFILDVDVLEESWSMVVQQIFPQAHVITATLDTVVQKVICGQGILRIDAHLVECLMVKELKALLKQIDVIIVKLTLRISDFVEVLSQIESLGFYYFDDVGEWRDSSRGTLIQKDILFVKQRIIQAQRVMDSK